MAQNTTAAPDLTDLTAAYAHTVQAILDLGRSLREGDAERPTACPGWSVKDQFAHIVSLEAWVQGEAPPDIDVSDRPHVRSGLNAVVERFLESSRALPRRAAGGAGRALVDPPEPPGGRVDVGR